MNKSAKLTILGTFLALGITAKTQAATEGAANAFLNVNISLNGVTQRSDSGMGKIHLSTQNVLAAIGHDTTNNFSPAARLLLKFPVGLEAGPSFVVRDIINRTNAVDFDVPSSILWLIQIGDSVESSHTNLTGMITANQVTIWELEFQSSGASFDVQGYTTTVLDNHGNHGAKLADTCPVTVSARVTGTGADSAGDSAVLQGTVMLSGRKIVEIH